MIRKPKPTIGKKESISKKQKSTTGKEIISKNQSSTIGKKWREGTNNNMEL